MSTATGEYLTECHTIRDLLHKALVDILCLPMDLISVANRLKGYLGVRKVSFVKLGPYGLDRYVEKSLALSSTRCLEPSLSPEASSNTLMDADSEPIAIIGMSGRFPGAESVEAFWNLLQDGVDTVREVCYVPFIYIFKSLKVDSRSPQIASM